MSPGIKNLLVGLLALTLCSCSTLRSFLDDPPIVAAVNVGSVGATGEPGVWIRTDAETVVAHATVDASVSVFDKATGATLYGPLRLSEGKRLVFSRKRDFNETFELGDPLPAWCRVVFQPGDFGQLSLVFDDEVTP